MSEVRSERLGRPGLATLRKTNRKAVVSYFAQKGRLFTVLGTTALFVLFALLYVWCNHQCVRVGYGITSLYRERAVLTDLNRKYKVELANLTALDRLEQEARTKLGLTVPGTDQVQVIE